MEGTAQGQREMEALRNSQLLDEAYEDTALIIYIYIIYIKILHDIITLILIIAHDMPARA